MNGEAWKWRMRSFDSEEELVGECVKRLTSVVLQVSMEDKCVWNLHSSNGYTVNGAYNKLTKEVDNFILSNTHLLWLKVVPLKVYIFVWRLGLNRVPTRDNLFKQRILVVNEQG